MVTAAFFLLGGFIPAVLPKSESMAGNVSLLSMLCMGTAVLGPLVAGAAMKAADANSLVWFTAATALVMAVSLLVAIAHGKP